MKPRPATGDGTAIVHHLLLLLVAATATYEGYNNCAPAPYTCGNTTTFVQYPFNVNGRPDYCGFQDYYLSCDANTTLITRIAGADYQVKEIDYSNNLLYIVDTTATINICGGDHHNNTAMGPDLYKFTARDVNLTLYINCTVAGMTNVTYANLGCSDSRSFSYYTVGRVPGVGDASCSSMTEVVVDVDAADQLRAGKIGIKEAVSKGFAVEYVAGKGWCNDCTVSGGFCGSVPPTAHACICSHGLTLGSCRGTGNNGLRKKIIIGVSAGMVVILILYILCGRKLYRQFLSWKYEVYDSSNISGFLKRHGSLAPKQYTYRELKRITKSFKNPLGHGGYGTVYKGKLVDGHEVAVKVLNEDSKGDGGEFINEVVSIGRTSHVNVVSLVGFCIHGSKRALVYDYMPNGSLEKYIHGGLQGLLGIQKLYEIAAGIARGLEYLHDGCNTRIVHFDIKPHNILLDENFCPKISDFGLAKLCPGKDSVVSMAGMRGTVGYIAPEVFSRNFGLVSSKSDVYSYGMMLLEMAGCMVTSTGKRSTGGSSEAYFPHWIYKRIEENGALIESCGVTGEMEEIGRKMVIVGLWCIQTMPENRPSIGVVIDMLQGTTESLQVPPMPFLSPPLVSLVSSYVSAPSLLTSSSNPNPNPNPLYII